MPFSLHGSRLRPILTHTQYLRRRQKQLFERSYCLSPKCWALLYFVVSNSQILTPPEKESRQFISSLNRFPPPPPQCAVTTERIQTTRTLQFDSYQEVVAPRDETLIQLDIAGNLKFGYSSQICNYGRRRQCSGTQRVNHELREKRYL